MCQVLWHAVETEEGKNTKITSVFGEFVVSCRLLLRAKQMKKYLFLLCYTIGFFFFYIKIAPITITIIIMVMLITTEWERTSMKWNKLQPKITHIKRQNSVQGTAYDFGCSHTITKQKKRNTNKLGFIWHEFLSFTSFSVFCCLRCDNQKPYYVNAKVSNWPHSIKR